MNIPIRTLWLVLPLAMAACDAPEPVSTDGGGIDRAPLGKADVVSGSCFDGDADFCGGQSAGACWCDDLCVTFGDCCADVDAACGVDGPDGPQMCGGFAGLLCPDGLTCVDDPDDSCDPQNGGADCSGICVEDEEPEVIECAGFLGLVCPEGLTCIDFPGDGCHPQNGGADCGGICVEPGDVPDPKWCGGFAGLQCDPGEVCVDFQGDDCAPWAGGADCIGVCVTP